MNPFTLTVTSVSLVTLIYSLFMITLKFLYKMVRSHRLPLPKMRKGEKKILEEVMADFYLRYYEWMKKYWYINLSISYFAIFMLTIFKYHYSTSLPKIPIVISFCLVFLLFAIALEPKYLKESPYYKILRRNDIKLLIVLIMLSILFLILVG